MLLEFTCKNYKTFKDEVKLSLKPTGSQVLSYSIIEQEVGNKKMKGLSSSVIYGPNATGKSNIISAMETLKHIVIFGLRNFDNKTPSRIPLLFPNFQSEKSEPIELGINFITDKLNIHYHISFSANGLPSEIMSTSCKVISELLLVNSKQIFKRLDKSLDIDFNNKLLKRFHSPISKPDNELKSQLENNLASTDLFLTNGFKNLICLELVELILNWFNNKLLLVYNSPRVQLHPRGNYESGKLIPLSLIMNKAIQALGCDNQIGYMQADESYSPVKTTVVVKDFLSFFIPSQLVESLGTLRFLDIFPLVLNAFQTGATLIVDELDASIHPVVIMSIIKAFHNDEININGAQLIFNTQNTSFLSKKFFRPDEIKLVDKNDQTKTSELYQLTNFKGFNPKSDYRSNYFKERYGAIPYIDLCDIIEEAVKEVAK